MTEDASTAANVFLVLTRGTFAEAVANVRAHGGAIWLNDGISDRAGIDALRAEGLDVTFMTYWIDPLDMDAVEDAIAMIAEHHPDQMILVDHASY